MVDKHTILSIGSKIREVFKLTNYFNYKKSLKFCGRLHIILIKVPTFS